MQSQMKLYQLSNITNYVIKYVITNDVIKCGITNYVKKYAIKNNVIKFAIKKLYNQICNHK